MADSADDKDKMEDVVKVQPDEEDEPGWLQERYELSCERIREMASTQGELQKSTGSAQMAPFDRYFSYMAKFLTRVNEVYDMICSGSFQDMDEAALQKINEELFRDVQLRHYRKSSYANPTFCCEKLGQDFGRMFCWLTTELRDMVPLAFQKRLSEMAAVQELFLTICSDFEDGMPAPKTVKEDIYWYVSDYADQTVPGRVRELLDPSLSFYKDIILDADLGSTRYLYTFGEPVGEHELANYRMLADMDKTSIEKNAEAFVDEFRKKLSQQGLNVPSRKYVQIISDLGFERIVRAAVQKFESAGYECIVHGKPVLSINKVNHYGFGTPEFNAQYEFDHDTDQALYLDKALCDRIVTQTRSAYEMYEDLAAGLAGPFYIDTTGKMMVSLFTNKEKLKFSEKQVSLYNDLNRQTGDIARQYTGAPQGVRIRIGG